VASSLYFSFANQYSLGGGFPFPIVLVPRYKLSLCHTPIKSDLLGFPRIDVFVCGLRDHVITRFASQMFYLAKVLRPIMKNLWKKKLIMLKWRMFLIVIVLNL
jgi:hypothetical protein